MRGDGVGCSAGAPGPEAWRGVEAAGAVAGGVGVDHLRERGEREDYTASKPSRVVPVWGRRGWAFGADFLNDSQSGKAEAYLSGEGDLRDEILAEDIGAPAAKHAGFGCGFPPGAVDAQVDGAWRHGQDLRQRLGEAGADGRGLAEAAGALVLVECVRLMAGEVDVVGDEDRVARAEARD